MRAFAGMTAPSLRSDSISRKNRLKLPSSCCPLPHLLTARPAMPIDVHAHYVPQRIIATLEERAKDFGVSLVKTPPQCALHFDYGLKVRPFFPKLIEPVNKRMATMARQGIDRQVLSTWTDISAYG